MCWPRTLVADCVRTSIDEPLANLDALLRLEMRVNLKTLHTGLKQTFVYVTHDQVEALSMGDRVGVMERGKLLQVNEPDGIYRYPEHMFVANILKVSPCPAFCSMS